MQRLLTTCFGLGLLPFAPGTWGSLAPAVLFMAVGILAEVSPALWTMAILIVVSSVITIVCSPYVIGLTGSKDPKQVVSDEVAGQALTYLIAGLIMPITGICIASAVGFGLFRLFDISKPWPCKKLEKLPAGYGILADDLAAAVLAAVVWFLLRKIGLSV